MAKKNIQSLIDDLDYIENNFDTLFGEKMNNIVAELIVAIGKSAAYDTGLVRDLIANILMDLGRPDLVDELECQIFEFWKSREQRELENSDYQCSVKKSGTSRDYLITIEDDGFYNQQQGKVSSIHPRNDGDVIPFNVDFYQDKLETGADNRMNLACDELHDLIVKVIERGVRNG